MSLDRGPSLVCADQSLLGPLVENNWPCKSLTSALPRAGSPLLPPPPAPPMGQQTMGACTLASFSDKVSCPVNGFIHLPCSQPAFRPDVQDGNQRRQAVSLSPAGSPGHARPSSLEGEHGGQAAGSSGLSSLLSWGLPCSQACSCGNTERVQSLAPAASF